MAGRALLVMVKSLRSPGALGVGVFAVSVDATGRRSWRLADGTHTLGRGAARLRNGRAIHRTRRGLPDATEDGAVGAFLDVELGRRSDPSAQRINVAAGVPHDGDRVGITPGGEQGPRASKSGARVRATITSPSHRASNWPAPK